jgi:gluconolactonase
MLACSQFVTAADLSELVGGKVEKVVGDCQFTEGPAWHPAGYLLFSDIPNLRIVRVNPDGSHSDWLKPSGGANGLMCDKAGNVYACQGDEQRVTRLTVGPDQLGKIGAVLAGRFDGEPFNKPNDLALDADGGLYFTDPNYRQAMPSQPVQGVYYVSVDGKVTRVVSDLPRPNGILVSPDGKTLYVANIEKRQIMAYPIVAPGTISEGKVLFTADEALDGARGPDGMSVDEQGNLYGAYKSIVVIGADGTLKGRIEVPEKPSNCAFGGTDNSTLYITAQKSLYKVAMKVPGMPLQAKGPQGTESVALLDDTTEAEDASSCDDAAKTKEVSLQGLKLTVPEGWTQSEPTSSLRLGQFAIPAAEGDAEPAEYVVFPPFGGSAKANIDRWVAQFDAEGRESKMTQGESTQGKYILVELTGTYKKPFGPPFAQQTKPAPGYKMLGVILTSKEGGNYFIKVTGPQKTVAASAAAIRASFGASADKETKYELPAE